MTLGDGFKTLAVQEDDGSWRRLLDGKHIPKSDVKSKVKTEWTESEMP